MEELKPGIYEHYKGGRYEVIGVAFHSEKIEDRLVVYKMLYDRAPFKKGQLCVRPLELFLGVVKVEGKEVPRFKFVEPSKDLLSRLKEYQASLSEKIDWTNFGNALEIQSGQFSEEEVAGLISSAHKETLQDLVNKFPELGPQLFR